MAAQPLTSTGCSCGDDRYHCRFGYHHVVPRLAADCSGRSHNDHVETGEE